MYYIFASDKNEVIKTKVSKAAFSSSNLDECVERFNKYIKEIRYKHMYMIVDFGDIGNRGFFKSQCINPLSHSDYIPFLVIMEYHFGDDRSKLVRADHTEILHYGFKQSFENNLSAVKCFNIWLERGEAVKFIIKYRRKVHGKGTSIYICGYEKSIADSKSILRRNSLAMGPSFITRFKITPLDKEWEFEPIEQPRIADVKLKKKEDKEEKIKLPELTIMNYKLKA